MEYFDGGIVVDERFETSISGLFAAGECCLGRLAQTGSFRPSPRCWSREGRGPQRGRILRSISLPRPKDTSFDALECKAEKPLTRSDGENPAQVRRTLQSAAHRQLGPIRTEQELTSFIEFLEATRSDTLPYLAARHRSRAYNKEWLDALELANIVHLLTASAKSALARTESRGVHARADFPRTDNDAWLTESITTYRDCRFTVTHRPARSGSITPPGGSHDYLDMMKYGADALPLRHRGKH